jgi:hypothetical protein
MSISSIISLPNVQSFEGRKKTETKKDHFGRNLTIAASLGAGTSYGFRKLGEYINEKSDISMENMENAEKKILSSTRYKVVSAGMSAFFFSLCYLAARAIKYREKEDHLGRNALIASGLGATAGFAGIYEKVLIPLGTKLYGIPEDVVDKTTDLIKTAPKKARVMFKHFTALGAAIAFPFYFLAGKGLYDKIKGEKTFGAQKTFNEE